MAEKTSRAFAAHEQGTVVKDWTFPLRPMGDHDVEIKITHCGMCASDIHTINGEWGKMPLPIVVGHEIIGHVTAVGKGVTKHKIGDRVGVGPQQLSCFTCNQCKRGKEVYCSKGFVATYGGGSTYPSGYISKGGYAEFHRVHEHFAIPIPASIPSEKAAPLLCAGITVYSPLRRFNAGPGKNVGVIGIGGLGHLAIQFASKLGATVTAISTSRSKEAEAKQLGADNFFVLEDTEAMFQHAGELDLLINTASHSHDVSTLMNLLQPEGTFLQLGGGQGEITVDSFSLLFKGQAVAGSLVGSPDQISEMLNLCAKHHVYPMTEVIPLAQVNEGIQKVLANKPRYRLVLDIQNHYK